MAMILGPYTMSFEGQSKEQFARPEWDGKFKDRWVRAHASRDGKDIFPELRFFFRDASRL